MDTATVYVSDNEKLPLNREILIYENAEATLLPLANMERQVIPRKNTAFDPSSPGLNDIVSLDPVIAMGMLSHMQLADFQKRSLLAGDLGPDDDARDGRNLKQLIWSCANTSIAVAVGDDAWQAMQMLPVADRRYYAVPPLKLLSQKRQPQTGTNARSLFIINHDAEDHWTRELAERATDNGFKVACSGLSQSPRHRRLPVTDIFCCSEAAIHIHVGHHATASKPFRLIDSWHSGRLAMQFVPPGPETGCDPGNLQVAHEVNGFICHSPKAALSICEEALQDHVLTRKLIEGGRRSAEPLARAWSAIAQDLLH